MSSRARRGAQAGVKVLAAAYDYARPPADGVVILAYHRVSGSSALELDLDPALFRDQMHWLGSECRVSALDDAARELPGASGPSTVAVTFDDGTADFTEHALPALVDAGVPATYYIATRFIDEGREFPDAGKPMTWSALAEAVSTGLVTVGSHTHSHAVLDKLGSSEAEGELRRAAELIEDKLGVAARHFAYPKGVFGGEANERVVARYHHSAALAASTVNHYGSTALLRLDRVPIQRSDGMAYFKKKVRGGLRLEGQLRGTMNRIRYRNKSA